MRYYYCARLTRETVCAVYCKRYTRQYNRRTRNDNTYVTNPISRRLVRVAIRTHENLIFAVIAGCVVRARVL